MRAILSLLALFCLTSVKSLNVTLRDYTVTDDNSLLCGTDLNNNLVVFSATNDLIVQNLTADSSSSIISGDGQWIVVIQNETINFYIRQAQRWTLFTSTPLLFNHRSLSSIFFDKTGSRLVLVTGEETYFYSKSSTSKDYTLWSQRTIDRQASSFNGDLSTAFELINSSLFVSTVDWANQKMIESTEIGESKQGGEFLAVNSAGTAFTFADHQSHLYRKISNGWTRQNIGDTLDVYGFSGDDQFLFRLSSGRQLSRYLVGDLTRAYLPQQVLPSNIPNRHGPWHVHSNYDGSQVIYDHIGVVDEDDGISPTQLTIPFTLHQAGEICLNDTWCQSDLKCGPGHYCHQLNRRAQPDTYTALFKEYLWVQLNFESPAQVTCNVAGSNPIGVQGSVSNVYNNTRVQVVYHNSTGLSRVVEAGYLKAAANFVHVEPLQTESRTIEFWLSCVCVDDYVSSVSPTKLSLELPAATSSTSSDIHTAPPTHSESSAAVIGITTTLVVCLSMMM
ncbi:hypothetical protein PROFUN_13681 [Planoprotostelium fungivorum]|uniref:Uncharacterized protein n=1 Tax=Planoprotostelium fungivorum TaxID=1890364 RepID=A0A2P6N3B2_9EUKA|nr:hypothetical protein PROFUN_13681 [Planoprotostelium fungivorum]